MSVARPYQVYVYAGERPQEIPSARVVDITPAEPTAESMVEKVSNCGLTSADLRSKVVFVVDPQSSGEQTVKALLAYVAMLGLARRRLDVAFGFDSAPIVMADLDSVARRLPDAGKPSDPPACLKVSDGAEAEEFVPDLVLGTRLGVVEVTSVRHAKRLSYLPPDQVTAALPQFIAISSIRARGEAERLPSLSLGSVDLDLETVRKSAENLRRTLRGDDRSAVVPPAPVPAYMERLNVAASRDIQQVLTLLGARSKTVEVPVKDADGNPTDQLTSSTVWHCLHPENHTHNDASPSARVTEVGGVGYYRCFRCLAEKVDSLRLVMWAKDITAEEAADWILANVPA